VKSQRAFGEALRRHREQSGVTIESIARQTKISAPLLRSLEKGDCSRWPTGIYSRAYVREYAVAIGLDPDDLAAQFSECFADTAFPERPVAKKEHAGFPPAEPMRLTLATEPGAQMRIARRRVALVLLDFLLIFVLAAALRITIVANFWMALAGVAIACHSLALAAGGRGAADIFAGIFRTQPDPAAEEAPSPVTEGI
jgi:transcriptional regulator with XRE-family HTH domain